MDKGKHGLSKEKKVRQTEWGVRATGLEGLVGSVESWALEPVKDWKSFTAENVTFYQIHYKISESLI